eukprot:Sspe_Gene.47048::Locus_23732_Transcript_1_1_Confidence_1.000_Length_1073::g.47048::m.47048
MRVLLGKPRKAMWCIVVLVLLCTEGQGQTFHPGKPGETLTCNESSCSLICDGENMCKRTWLIASNPAVQQVDVQCDVQSACNELIIHAEVDQSQAKGGPARHLKLATTHEQSNIQVVVSHYTNFTLTCDGFQSCDRIDVHATATSFALACLAGHSCWQLNAVLEAPPYVMIDLSNTQHRTPPHHTWDPVTMANSTMTFNNLTPGSLAPITCYSANTTGRPVSASQYNTFIFNSGSPTLNITCKEDPTHFAGPVEEMMYSPCRGNRVLLHTGGAYHVDCDGDFACSDFVFSGPAHCNDVHVTCPPATSPKACSANPQYQCTDGSKGTNTPSPSPPSPTPPSPTPTPTPTP